MQTAQTARRAGRRPASRGARPVNGRGPLPPGERRGSKALESFFGGATESRPHLSTDRIDPNGRELTTIRAYNGFGKTYHFSGS